MQRLVPTNKLINVQNVILKCSKQNLRTSSVTLNANRLLVNKESNTNRNLVINSSRYNNLSFTY